MYPMLLTAHSLWRWVVLAAVGARALWAAAGWLRGREWTPLDRRLSAASVGTADLQFLIGVILYVGFSPVVHAALADPGAAMKDSQLRFAFVEHPTMMFLGLVCLHVGSVVARRRPTDAAKHRADLIGHALGFALLLAGLPR